MSLGEPSVRHSTTPPATALEVPGHAVRIMGSFTTALLKIRQACLLAVKSLMRGTSLLYTAWYVTTPVVRENDVPRAIPSGVVRDFVLDAATRFLDGTTMDHLARLSVDFQQQYRQYLQDNFECMLPSFNHLLPSGSEHGRCLALDVGGSTFRVAVIELLGQCRAPHVLIRKSYKIDAPIRALRGHDFFDWMAQRIIDTVGLHDEQTDVLPMGMAWSFPIEQTSLRSGSLQPMGKSFMACEGLVGEDLASLIEAACARRNLRVDLHAIVNDSLATLFSKAYEEPSTRFGLVLGTGLNVAVDLPIHLISREKFGQRPEAWHAAAQHVIVNTELSMFGKGFLPLTRWDHALAAALPRPDFQPLEYILSGHYLGEIVRRVLVDGAHQAGLFGGMVPVTMTEPYSLSTEVVSKMQHTTMDEARAVFCAAHPKTVLLDSDITALRQIATAVTMRAAAVLAAAIHGLWKLQLDAERVPAASSREGVIAYNGSVIESYPGFRHNAQTYLDALVERSGSVRGALTLTPADDSSLLGAAVAVSSVAMSSRP